MLQKKLNKEINTDGVTLRPKFFDEQHFVNEAVKFPVALLENAKVTIIQKIFGRYTENVGPEKVSWHISF